jgi:hypothetical protein
MKLSRTRGVLNDAVSIYFLDATLASAFVARWCLGSKIETDDGVFRCAAIVGSNSSARIAFSP